MNKTHNLYLEYEKIKWSLDDWAIPKECFDKIVEILPFNSTILELGSGSGTQILSKFYNMISIETDEKWLNRYNSNYLYVPFDEDYKWYNIKILKEKLRDLSHYDLLLIDGPKGWRSKIVNHIDLFNQNIPWIFDDTMAEEHLNTMIECCNKMQKPFETFDCVKNPKATFWKDGKKFSLVLS